MGESSVTENGSEKNLRQRSVTVALLAYKEEENLRVLLPRIKEQMDQIGCEYEILIVDTHEPLDGTPFLCKEMGARYVNQPQRGFGDAFRAAIRHAEKELFLILDSDGSHDPQYIPSIYHKFIEEECDIVIGSRYVKGGKTHDSKVSVLMSRILNFCFRIAIGIRAKDISTDYRLYESAQLKKVQLQNENYDVLQEVLLKLKIQKPDLKIREVPITFEKRMFGESKRRLLPFIWDYMKSLFRLTSMRIKAKV